MRFFQKLLSRPHIARPTEDLLSHSITQALCEIPVDFGGGCPPKKAYALAWLIRSERILTSLDIGVYRGRSLVPQAIAHRDYTGGTAFGVDPFSNTEAEQHDNPALAEKLHDFAVSTDFDRIHSDLLSLCDRLQLGTHCRLVRTTSSQAARNFAAEGQRFGLIHIDGNHDRVKVQADVEDYLPLLAPRGFIVVDDVSWASVKPAVDELASKTTLLFYESRPTVTEIDYAVFWTGRSRRRAAFLRESLARLHA